MCTESGIWQPVQFNCIFDPLAISLEEGGLLEGKTQEHIIELYTYILFTIFVWQYRVRQKDENLL